ncbi:MAG: hypothetical protein K8F51_04380 [Comamonas sp.]|nr:hypothetical protein [Comamonas sp.]
MSATALGIAATIFNIRLMYLAGTDLEDLYEIFYSKLEQECDEAISLFAFILFLSLMLAFQYLTLIISSWVLPFWSKALHLIPITAWLGFFTGLGLLKIHDQFLQGIELIEKRYITALVIFNFLLCVVITYFYSAIT